MSDASPQPLDEVRDVLFGDQLHQVEVLRTQVHELSTTVRELEALIVELNDRAAAVGEVLVAAVATPQERPGELGSALRPEIEHAVHESARADSVILANALYPVMGPAMRKMITAMFTVDRQNPGETFVVDSVLLIERESGVLLAAAHRDLEDAENADVVSGMLDAIRLFVQDAFEAEEHDGLTNLRVGDTAVLVEWGPRAVLASVITGIATPEYRANAAETLERLHRSHAVQLQEFSGDVSAFENALAPLGKLRAEGEPKKPTSPWLVGAGLALVLVVLVPLLLWLF